MAPWSTQYSTLQRKQFHLWLIKRLKHYLTQEAGTLTLNTAPVMGTWEMNKYALTYPQQKILDIHVLLRGD